MKHSGLFNMEQIFIFVFKNTKYPIFTVSSVSLIWTFWWAYEDCYDVPLAVEIKTHELFKFLTGTLLLYGSTC